MVASKKVNSLTGCPNLSLLCSDLEVFHKTIRSLDYSKLRIPFDNFWNVQKICAQCENFCSFWYVAVVAAYCGTKTRQIQDAAAKFEQNSSLEKFAEVYGYRKSLLLPLCLEREDGGFLTSSSELQILASYVIDAPIYSIQRK